MKRFTTYFTEINQKNGFQNPAKINLRLLSLLFMLFFVGEGFAATRTWDGGAGTLVWTTATNWSGDVAPVVGDDVVFNTAGTYTITGVPTLALNSLTITTGNVTFSGSSTTLTIGGNAGTDFAISNGASFILGTNLSITMAASSTADISGAFTINTSRTWTITNSTTCTVGSTGSITNSGTITGATAAKLIFEGDSSYTHNQNGGTVPIADWNGATGTGTSTCYIVGVTTTGPTNVISTNGSFPQTTPFYNLEWNCTNQTSNISISSCSNCGSTTNFTLASNNLNVVSTGTAILILNSGSTMKMTLGSYSQSGGIVAGNNNSSTSSGNSNSLTISRNFTLTGGIFEVLYITGGTSGGCGYASTTISGNLSISGGTFDLSDIVASSGATSTANNSITLSGNLSLSSTGVFTASDPTTTLIFSGTSTYTKASSATFTNTNINITVNSGATLTLASDISIASSRTFTISGTMVFGTGSTDQTNSFNITGAGTVTVTNATTTTLKITNPYGITTGTGTTTTAGNIRVSTSRPAYGNAVNYHYIGDSAQVTGNALPSSITTGKLVINNTETITPNSTGVTLSQSTSINNTSLILTKGILTTVNSQILSINISTSATATGSNTSYINGPLRRTFGGSTPYTNLTLNYPVGAGGRFLPFTITDYTGGTGTPGATVQAFDANCNGTVNGICALSNTEYWAITPTNTVSISSLKVLLGRPEDLGNLNIVAGYPTTVGGSYSSLSAYSGYPLNNSIRSNINATLNTTSSYYFTLGSSSMLQGGTATATSGTICYGATTTIKVSGYLGSIQWQQSTNQTDWSNVSGGTTSTYTTPNLTVTTYYRAMISGSSPCSPTTATSSTATVTVNPDNTNTWSGATSTNWNTASNWVCSSVPTSITNVVIPSGATNMPNISSANATANSVTINSGASLTMGSYTLTLTDGGSFTNNGTFNAGTGTVTFAGVGTIEGAASLTFNNLTITGGTDKGVVANKDFTVNGELYLGANPNATDGALDMVIDYGNYATGAYTSVEGYSVSNPLALTTANPALKNNTSTYNNLSSYVLLLGPNASTTGTGDVTGKIRRTSFVPGTPYTFGNTNTLLTFTANNINELPTQITVVATRGPKGRHADKSNETNKTSIKRLYQILRTGGETTTKFTVRFSYEQSEVENNTNENNLVLWDHHIPYSGITPHEHGKTFNSSVDNYVELSNHGLYYLANETIPLVENYFTKYWMISESVIPIPTWLGAVPGGSWTSASNWTSGVVPTTTSSIIIPDQVNTPNNPNLGSDLTLGTIEIQPGGVLSAGARNITLTGGVAENGGRGTWINSGTFNAGTGTVIFDKAGATYAGNTAFNNITINADKSLILQNGSILKIGNTLTNNGTLDASTNPNTIEYNGTAEQTTTGLPATISSLTINNAANVALTNPITITFNLTLTNGNLNVGANTLTYSGSNITKTGGFINASSNNPTLNFTNSTALTLPASLFVDNTVSNMTINGSGGTTLGSNTTITNYLTLTNGNLNVGANNTLTYSGSSISKEGGFINASSNNATLNLTNSTALTLPASLFVDNTVSNMTINGSGGTTLGSDTTVSNQLTLTTGDFNLNTSTLTLNGPYIGGTLNNLRATNSSSINFNNTEATSVTLPNFTAIKNLGFNASAMTYNLVNNITVHGDLNITNGTVNSSSHTLNRNEAGGTLTLGNGSSLFIGGTNTLPTNYATHSVNESSTVSYNGESQAVGQLKSSQSYGNLTLSGTGTKTFTDDTDAKISGHFSVEGPTVTPPTKLTFNGTSTQNIAGLPYNNIEFSEAGTKTFTSSASLSPTAEITFSGTPGMVDFDGVNNNLEFVLQSTTEGTARVGNTGNTSNTIGWTLNGQLRAERFVPAKRAWRLLTAPLKGNANNSIYANWQGTTNEGLLLWHPQGGGDTGLAVGPQSNIWSYSGTGWASVTNTNTANLYDGSTNNAYLVFATGFFGSQNISSGADATTIRAKGALITGDKDYSLVANQFKLIGNPYASPINTEVIVSDLANSGSKIWLLDPTNGLGAYVTYDGTNWSVPTPSGNDKYIQSGQAFFIRRNSNTFTVKESHKVAGNSNTWFERNANNETNLENSDRIRVLLYKQDTNNWLFADGALAVNSSNGNNNVDDTDATKISNFNESLMFRNGTTNLSIEYRALPQLGDLQPLRLTGTTNGSYQLRLYTENYTNSTIQPYLEDTQTTSIYEIPTDGSEIIVPFEGVVSNSSNPITRFRIVYQTTLSTEDPMNFGVSIYPNPVKNGYLTISLDNYSSNTTYSLTNLLGQQVQSGNLLLLDNLINVNTIQKGVYIINIKQQEKYYSKKLIIN